MNARLMRPIYPTVVGLFLGLVQSGLFFQLSLTLSSSFGTFLLVTLCWLAGSALGVIWLAKWQLPTELFISSVFAAYTTMILLLGTVPFETDFMPVYGGLVGVIGIYPGVFFARASAQYRASVLFFRENNGFILGLIFGTILFAGFGRPALWGFSAMVGGVLLFYGCSLHTGENQIPDNKMN